MKLTTDRALEEVLGGSRGGWYFWLAFLAQLDELVARSRDRGDAFCSFPRGELGRVLRDVEDAFGLAVTAVAAQQLVNEEDVDLPEATIVDVLERRVREVRQDREL
ncbi:MAG TPA: hypothetical protein VIM33_04825 [Gaiellaceae bacterium]